MGRSADAVVVCMCQDCPMTLPDVPHMDEAANAAQGERPLVEHHLIKIGIYCNLAGLPDDCGAHVTKQKELAPFIRTLHQQWLASMGV